MLSEYSVQLHSKRYYCHFTVLHQVRGKPHQILYNSKHTEILFLFFFLRLSFSRSFFLSFFFLPFILCLLLTYLLTFLPTYVPFILSYVVFFLSCSLFFFSFFPSFSASSLPFYSLTYCKIFLLCHSFLYCYFLCSLPPLTWLLSSSFLHSLSFSRSLPLMFCSFQFYFSVLCSSSPSLSLNALF